ncbi:MAG: D-alanyl-D-alanine carboxypeptidase [Actinomycetota bacterium]|nr:D-alanyl-D-alanine carboxypeptidase [Actinomycetota bacterium]
MRQRTCRAHGTVTLILLSLALLVFPTPDRAGAQENDSANPSGAPNLDAESWAVVDRETGLYLAGKDPDRQVPIASTTKVMVALVALEDGAELDREVTVSENAASYAGGLYSAAGLYPYDSVSVRELLEATLVPSGTDAVYALAEHLGDGSVEEFVGKMNDKAREMGLENTHFENPAGLDTRGHYSSARDLAEITREALEYPEFREIVGKAQVTITTQDREIPLDTTNLLVAPNSGYDYDAAIGVKTGTSPAAGPSLISAAQNGEESYVAVVLGAAEDLYRFEASRTALEYGFGDFGRESFVKDEAPFKKLQLPYRREESVQLVAEKSVSGLGGPGLEVEQRVQVEKEAPPSAEAGQELGTVEVFVDGRSAGTTPLVTAKGYDEAGLWQKTRYWTGGALRGISNWISETAAS